MPNLKDNLIENPKENINNTISLGELLYNNLLDKRDAEILASFLLEKSREYVLSHLEITVNYSVLKKFKKLEKKRLENYPIAYLTGKQEFYGLDFIVNKNVLVPRPETEIMVDEIINIFKGAANSFESTNFSGTNFNSTKVSSASALDVLSDMPLDKPIIIDIGTGSGAIIISLATELKRLLPSDFENFEFKAIDISKKALKVAKNNSIIHKLNKTINFYRGNLLEPITKLLSDKNLIIAANLPYLNPSQVKESPSISQEPKLALIAGNDGLKYYLELFEELKNIKYKSLTLFCEIDQSQSEKIISVAEIFFPSASCEIIKDLSGLDRFLMIIN